MALSTRQLITLRRLVDLVFPASDDSPAASTLQVDRYIDLRLDTPWGQGLEQYQDAPFDAGSDRSLGWQTALSPLALYARMLDAIEQHALITSGLSFHELDNEIAVALFRTLEDGSFVAPPQAPVWLFFDLLLKHVTEGLFRDPALGGNLNGDGWAWLTSLYDRDVQKRLANRAQARTDQQAGSHHG
ncbi:MAG: gluconate 2-dehydrogenase subunit 3 family protein [Janthinobacterium lividum]